MPPGSVANATGAAVDSSSAAASAGSGIGGIDCMSGPRRLLPLARSPTFVPPLPPGFGTPGPTPPADPPGAPPKSKGPPSSTPPVGTIGAVGVLPPEVPPLPVCVASPSPFPFACLSGLRLTALIGNGSRATAVSPCAVTQTGVWSLADE